MHVGVCLPLRKRAGFRAPVICSSAATMLLKAGMAIGFTMSLAMVVGGPMCDRGTDKGLTRRSPTAPRLAPLMISFDDKQIDVTAPAAVRDLAFLAGEARVDASLALFVHGFARDERDFGENLRLAEARARSVARILIDHGAPLGRVLLAAAEHANDDESGRRCEVELVRVETVAQLLGSLQVARHPGDSPELPSASKQKPD